MYKVGKKTLLLEDEDRPNWTGPGNRPLLTEIWYPASDDAVTEPFEFGSPEPLFQFDAIALDVEVKQQSTEYPFILLSHGTGGSALGMGWLGQYLASQGYITAAVNHHGNNAIEPYLAHGFMLWWERATDFSVLLDKLLNEVDLIKDKIDEQRIGFAGFSQGGCTAIFLAGGCCSLDHLKAFCDSDLADSICYGPREYPNIIDQVPHLMNADSHFRESIEKHHHSYKDSRIKAAFAIAPALGMAFPEVSLAQIDIPVQIVTTDIDNEVPPGTNAHRFAKLIPGARLKVIPGKADHYVFLNEATTAGRRLEPDICIDHPSVDRHQVHRAVAQQAADFFSDELA